MVQTECVTDQEVVRLDTIELRDLLLSYCELDQGHMGKQREQHRRCWGGGQAFVPWELLVMRLEVQTDLPLDNTVDQYPTFKGSG